MPYQLYFSKTTPSSFQIFNKDTPTFDLVGDEMNLLLFEGEDVFLRIPVSYEFRENHELGFWSTKEGFCVPERIHNQKKSKTHRAEVPILHFFSHRLFELAQKDSFTLEEFFEASINLLCVVEERLYPETGYYHSYLNQLSRNEAWDYLGIPPDPTPENVGPFVPVHFVDGTIDKVAIIDTERIGDVAEALLGILKSPHIHEERRDYP